MFISFLLLYLSPQQTFPKHALHTLPHCGKAISGPLWGSTHSHPRLPSWPQHSAAGLTWEQLFPPRFHGVGAQCLSALSCPHPSPALSGSPTGKGGRTHRSCVMWRNTRKGLIFLKFDLSVLSFLLISHLLILEKGPPTPPDL